MLVGFLAKRVAVLAVAVAAALLYLRSGQIDMGAGVLLGAFVSVYRVYFNHRALMQATTDNGHGAKKMVVALLSQILVFVLLFITALAGVYLFFGFTAGLLLVPLVICINAFSERLGITRNQWGEGSGQ